MARCCVRSVPEARQDCWFEYTVAGGRVSGHPVHWKGWLVTTLLMAGPPLVLASPFLLWAGAIEPLLAIMIALAMLPALLALQIAALVALVLVKGRRREGG